MQIVNLVSNDVRRFDDAMPFWVFLWVGPLELICVLILLSIQLGAPAAFAGVATMLLVIPLQVCQLGLPVHCMYTVPRVDHICPDAMG